MIAVPSLGGSLGSGRLFGMMLLFLAPFCICGAKAIVDVVYKFSHLNTKAVPALKTAAVLPVVVPYFLFHTGFIFEVTEHASNFDFLPFLSQHPAIQYPSLGPDWSYLVSNPYPEQNVYASVWLASARLPLPVHTDAPSSYMLVGYGSISPNAVKLFYPNNLNQTTKHGYICLGAANLQNNNLTVRAGLGRPQIPIASIPAITSSNLVYTNGRSEVYFSP